MLQEIFLGEKLQWPKPYKCAVNFVFNYQGAEGLEPDSKGRIDAEEYARREYGPRVGNMENFAPVGQVSAQGDFCYVRRLGRALPRYRKSDSRRRT